MAVTGRPQTQLKCVGRGCRGWFENGVFKGGGFISERGRKTFTSMKALMSQIIIRNHHKNQYLSPKICCSGRINRQLMCVAVQAAGILTVQTVNMN